MDWKTWSILIIILAIGWFAIAPPMLDVIVNLELPAWLETILTQARDATIDTTSGLERIPQEILDWLHSIGFIP